jgi:hypothetical protein
MLNVRFNRRVLWILALIAILPVLWMLQIEVAYERNVRHGIPADFTVHRPHVIEMWKV